MFTIFLKSQLSVTEIYLEILDEVGIGQSIFGCTLFNKMCPYVCLQCTYLKKLTTGIKVRFMGRFRAST